MRTSLSHPRELAGAALALGAAADLLFYGRMPGISAPIFLALCLAALAAAALIERRAPDWRNLWLGGAALLFAGLTAARAEPTLVFLNACAAGALILLQVGLFRGPSLTSLPAARYLLHAVLAGVELCVRPMTLAFEAAASLGGRGQVRHLAPVGRGLALALPVVGVFGVLLMAADSVFAGYVLRALTLQLPVRFDLLAGHGGTILVAGWVCGGALLTAMAAAPTEDGALEVAGPWGLGCVEALTVLLCVDLLFASFMVIQAAYLFGGHDTLAKTGMTFADYARRGFFELLTVAVLSLGLLLGLAAATKRERAWQPAAFNGACAMLILLTLGLLASAFQRMWLYEQAYGFTHLRIYTHTFMIWLAGALALFLAALLTARPRLFTFGALATGLLTLALLTAADPEALIVRANVARYQQTGQLSVGGFGYDSYDTYAGDRGSRELDASFLTELSTDATPALVEALPALDPAAQALVRGHLAEQRAWLEQVDREGGWASWHLSRARAAAALRALP